MPSAFTSLATSLALLALSAQLSAESHHVDRLVARVDGSPILLSDLMRASRPRLAHQSDQPAWRRAHALRLALREAREDAIWGALLEQHARRLGLGISDGEVDAALVRIAADQRVGVDVLLAEAHAAGFPPAAYRAELRRQLLEHRLLMSEPYSSAGGPPEDRAALLRWLGTRRRLLTAELRRRACIERFGRF